MPTRRTTMTNPYGTPAAYPPPPPYPPRRKRPVWPWFLGGGAVLVVLVFFVVVIAAVASAPRPDATGVTTSEPGNSAAAPVESTQSDVSASGFKQMKVGEEASFGPNDGGDPIVKFTITKITVDPKCGPYMRRGAGKHTLVLDVTAQTLGFPDGTSQLQIAGVLNPFAFQTKASDGTTHAVTFSTCLAKVNRMPDQYSPNSKYTGQIEIEADDKAGSLLLARNFSNGSGWEWPF